MKVRHSFTHFHLYLKVYKANSFPPFEEGFGGEVRGFSPLCVADFNEESFKRNKRYLLELNSPE